MNRKLKLKHIIAKKLQPIIWISLTNNFIINRMGDFKAIKPMKKCEFIPITMENYYRVRDFREENRVLEYREKLTNKEIGFFAEHNKKMIGSIWATINRTKTPKVVRISIRLGPNEGLIHDIVTGQKSRGMRVGPFMLSKMSEVLIAEYRLSKIIIDVNIRNRPSLKMMNHAGLRNDHSMVAVSILGKFLLQKKLRKYS